MLLPLSIHNWFVRYGIDPGLGWEALEVTAPRMDETETFPHLEDEAELMGCMFDYISGMIAITVDEESALLTLLQHVIPLTITLSPFMETHIRTRILDEAEKVGVGVYGMFRIALYGER